MSSQGKSTAQIGVALSVSERAARNGVAAFNRTGIESVPRAKATGRPRRLADIPTEAIDQVVADSRILTVRRQMTFPRVTTPVRTWTSEAPLG